MPREMVASRAPAASAGWGSRTTWLILFAIPVSVLVLSAILSPDPAGHGTHTQLGLPPCGFLVVTGIPCPGCGLTTCFAHMIRLDIVEAARANAFGVFLFLVTAASIPVSAFGFVRGLPVVETLDRLAFEKIAVLMAVCAVAVWVVRTAAHLLG